jgi:methyl-branched lipid omega-hydroxylase
VDAIGKVSPMIPESVLSLDEIDLSDPAFWERPWSEREGAFSLLRRQRPLAFFEEVDLTQTSALAPPPGPGYRAVTRHADVTEISRHPEIYCSGKGAVSIFDLPPEMVEYFAGMISTDNPRHARLRRIVSAAFNPRRIKSIEESIEGVTDKVIDRVAGLGSCDFVTEVATAMPLEIICDMMGVPPSEYGTVLRNSNVILSGGDPDFIPEGTDLVLAGLEAGKQLTDLMNELSAHRVDHPVDDLTTALITTNIDGEALTHDELASFFILLLTAGNETTRNSIAHGLWALTEHPDQRTLWQDDPTNIAATGVDEIVRWASPVIWMRRTVAQDTELSGQELHEGDKVLLFYNSANRDESVFEDPYRFDVRRSPNPHVGFGAAGPHFCLGAHLARREIDVMLRRLLHRLPDIEASAEPDRLRSSFINGIKHLPCRYTPA